MSDHVITTNSGLRFDYDRPTSEMISVDDIAVALGNCCRFAGHVRHYYSVAEHAVLVHKLVRDAGGDAYVCLAALHHDSHEAYLVDVPTPLKDKIKADAPGVWEAMEGAINAAIATKLGFNPSLFGHPLVVDADREALAYEASVLKVPETPIYGLDLSRYKTEAESRALIMGCPPEDACCLFWAAHLCAVRETNTSDAT